MMTKYFNNIGINILENILIKIGRMRQILILFGNK